MLQIDHLSASYKTIDGDVHVVQDANFTIYDNEIFGIAGESGCGKSTLLKALYDIIEFPCRWIRAGWCFPEKREANPSRIRPDRFANPGGTTFHTCPRRPCPF